MCICGFEMMQRNWLKLAVLAAESRVMPTSSATDPVSEPMPSAVAQRIVDEALSVDVHSHASGLIFAPKTGDDLTQQMNAGGISAVCLAHVADGPVIGRVRGGVLGLMRPAKPGELYRTHLERLDWVDQLVAGHSIRRVSSPAELRAAKADRHPAIVQDVEGCDFLDGRIERLSEGYRRGLRIMQLVHYIPNDIGDYQTGEVIHNGLTAFGAQVVRELNTLGAMIDVAHATETTVDGVLQVSTRPVLLSHTAIAGSKAQGDTPLKGRQISERHARRIAAADGVIGVWHFFPDLSAYVAGLREMVEVVGVDHVAIGTDQQVSAGALQDYRRFPALVDQMLVSGFSADDVKKIIGGNFMRLWQQVTSERVPS